MRPSEPARSARGTFGPLLGAVVLLGGCPAAPPQPDPTPVALADTTKWTRVSDPSVDSFADQRPADAVCEDAGWFIDLFFGVLEVETELCNYLTLRQAALEALEPGDVVEIQGYHDVLSSDDPAALGYLGLAIDGELVWQLSVPIPSDAAIIDEQFTVEQNFPSGAELQLHVHNHGPNTWELVSVQVTHTN